MRDTGVLGDKLIPKLVQAIRDTVIATKRGLAPLEHSIRVKATQDIIDKMGHEVAEHYGPIIDLMLSQDTADMHPAVRKLLEDSRSGDDQIKAMTGLLMGSVQGAIGVFLSNELAPFVYPLVALNPNLNMDPQSAVTAAATRVVDNHNAQQTVATQGFNQTLFNTMLEMALQYPAIADALEMKRRNLITEADLNLILQRNAVPASLIPQYRALANNPLSLADAALAYLRSDITLAEAQSIAHENGFTDAQLNVFIGNTGEPLGLMQLLEARRRGFIDEAVLEKGIKQSRIRNEWIPTAVALSYSPMSVADAVNAVVQNHITATEGQKVAEQNGLEAAAFPVLVQTAGSPLSRTEMQALYNRGEATRAQVDQAERESRLKDTYIADAFKLHVKLLEPRMLSTAVEVGAITQAEAIKRALEYGYSPADARILVGSGVARKLATKNQQNVTAAETLYIDNIITEAELKAVAKTAGFDAAEIDVIYTSAEYRRKARWVTSVISVIRSKYVAHHITKGEASSSLDSLGIPAERRDELLTVWDMERAATTAELTAAQIVKAAKNSLISPADALARLENKGYSAGDAVLLMKGA